MTNLNVLYEDNHIIVVVKPQNVLSQKDNTNDLDMLTLIKNYIKEKYQKPGNVYLGLVHRLDRPVGGVMVFAKTSKAAKRLNEQIKNNQMHKSYYAICHGIFENKNATLEDTIEKLDNKKVLLNTKNGKKAILDYKVIDEKENLSLLDINLITGRYHQIRLQLSSRNHPILGDNLYGSDNEKDIHLFAYRLSFLHPTTKEVMEFKFIPSGKYWDLFNLQ